ncbi:MAG: glycosyltransferase [Planctomycetota bacterium]|nr:glycosyltransferase [Planctomycetota bacterium]
MVLFAGGGSGGHISPGLAIAERLVERDPSTRFRFVCSKRDIDRTMLTKAGAPFTPIAATPPAIKPSAGLRFLINFRASRKAIGAMIRDESVTDVVALGGFVAAPVVSEARAQGIPILMTNLDDPPGRANSWMAPKCSRVISAIDLPDHAGFAEQVVGMPVRRNAIASLSPQECRTRLGLDPDKPTLLITGASQGSTSINRLVTSLARTSPECFKGWQIYHLAGTGADEEIRKAYEQAGIQALVEPFQHEMGLAWGCASLAISRAGASSVAEVAINAVPSLFLPYPYHQDHHQKKNAKPLLETGGVVLAIDHVDPERNLQEIGPVVKDLLASPDTLDSMQNSLATHRPPDAAGIIADLILDGIG